MQGPKKFGTFAGVFTPSILTILGVIMYLRLGWVVGEAGLINTLAIILIAHIISVTTGLSISSVATDKKIKTGGIYYILSRSLGLPMGGAIGLALFVATALSISLYLIGFAESFLSVPEISEFLMLEPDKLGLQVVGTAMIIFLVIIAFISTSLAIKTQFIILGAIALSLVSVFVGLFTNVEFHPQEINLLSSGSDVPLEYVFGIFFPAVTGFTAGVAMSGDLKNPKNSIPLGTLGSIVTGLVVYIALAIGLAYFVDRDLLINDSNFLMKIAWFAPLVLAGIWGATLSSALGGILGGPRIMQAMSQDKIGPKFLGKGYGESNEPRNALILVFIIAEAGILIGELNLVAKLVSMFYITAYGFINLAFALEQWASSDFRPSFKISRWFGIIGFLASFFVMFKLDTASMVGAIVIVMAIYFILKKKELQLDFGDVWQSVWSSIIRISLHRMDSKKLEDRNWRPNILLFSGSEKNRKHLSEFGKNLVGKHGFLSIFDLVQKNEDAVLKKQDQAIHTETSIENQGIFTRRGVVDNIYEGIEMVSNVYGFSGVEPNTVMLGWGRYSSEPERFVKMIHKISKYDHNLLMMDFDKNKGFGSYKTIDIWWRGTGNNGNLALQLVKFLWLSDDWRDAELRLMVINPVNDEKEMIHRKAKAVLDNLRMNAQICIINNQIEKKSVFDIIQKESLQADLTFMGIAPIGEGSEVSYVENMNKLCADIGTVMLVKASSRFKELNIGVKEKLTGSKRLEELNLVIDDNLEIDEPDLPNDPVLHTNVNLLWKEYSDLVGIASNQYYGKLFSYQNEIAKDLSDVYKESLKKIPDYNELNKVEDVFGKLSRLSNLYLTNSGRSFEEYKSVSTEVQFDILQQAIQFVRDESKRIRSQLSQNVILSYDKDAMEILPEDSFSLRMFKLQVKLHFVFSKKPYKYNLRYRRLIRSRILQQENKTIFELLNKWGQINLQFIIELQKNVLGASRSFLELSNPKLDKSEWEALRNANNDEVLGGFKKLNEINEASLLGMTQLHLKKLNEDVKDICVKLQDLDINRNIIPIRESILRKELQAVSSIPEMWKRNQELLLNQALLEMNLKSFTSRVINILNDTGGELQEVINEKISVGQQELKSYMLRYSNYIKNGELTPFNIELHTFEKQDLMVAFESVVDSALRRIRMAAGVFPEHITVFKEETFNDYYTTQFNNPATIDISMLRMLDYMIQNEFISPMEELVAELAMKLKKHSTLAQDIIRIINFSAGSSVHEKEPTIENYEMIGDMVKEQVAVLDKAEHDIEGWSQEINAMIADRTQMSYELLTLPSIMKRVVNLKQYIKDQENGRRWDSIVKVGKRSYKTLQKQLSYFWYRQSKGILLAQRLRKQESYDQTRVNDILDMYDQVSISDQVLHQVPFYYQQLFLRKEYYLNEFWVGRKKELEEFGKSYQRYKTGFRGAVMILGERGCGKSFFSHYAVHTCMPDAEVFTISAPFSGSSKMQDFDKAMRAVFETDNYESVLSELKQGTVVVFDGLEQWWEKSPGGYQVVNKILNLMSKYSDRIFFVLNANIHSFRVINSIKKIESKFLDLIELEAFNAEEIKEIIMLRHKSGNLRFELAERRNRKMMSWDNARLFSRYFQYSKGNIGVVLDAWIANVVDVEDGTLYVKAPKVPDISKLDFLENDWWLLLVQFVIHKRIHIKRLVKITMTPEAELSRKIQILKRSGVIVESSSDVWEINRFLYPHFRAKMKENEML
jgi:amino acid transporter